MRPLYSNLRGNDLYAFDHLVIIISFSSSLSANPSLFYAFLAIRSILSSTTQRSIQAYRQRQHHLLMVPTPHPSRITPNNLLPTRELINTRYLILTTLPRPAPMPVLLHSFPLERRTSSDLHIATRPDLSTSLASVFISIKRHRAGEIPVA